MLKISIIEGDNRSEELCRILRENHYNACLFETVEDGAKWSEIIIEPTLQATENITLKNFLARENFCWLNAIPTAEGAIEIALREMNATLHNSTVLCIGLGRIGSILCDRLKAFGSKVYCSTHDHDAKLRSMNINPVVDIKEILPECRLVVNTAPTLVMGYDELKLLPQDCVVIDLASIPGGIDKETAQKLGVKFFHALSLPGKTAPISAAGYMYETLVEILKERGAI